MIIQLKNNLIRFCLLKKAYKKLLSFHLACIKSYSLLSKKVLSIRIFKYTMHQSFVFYLLLAVN